jgi:hypothetical protein
MVSEVDRERLFCKISFPFLLASPLIVLALMRAHYSFVFRPLIFTIILILSVPLSLVIDLVLAKVCDPTGQLRFYIVKPSDEVQCLLSVPAVEGAESLKEIEENYLRELVATIRGRLDELGFQGTFEEDANEIRIAFQKAAGTPILSFMDHSIFGVIHVRLLAGAVQLQVRTTLDDTVLLDTGEFEKLHSISNYLALRVPTLSCLNVPLAIYCGLNLAFVASLATIPFFHVGSLLITVLSMGAAGMILAALFLMQRKRGQQFGYRLAFAGLYLAALPLLAQGLRLFFWE